jgi:hypothetical protein
VKHLRAAVTALTLLAVAALAALVTLAPAPAPAAARSLAHQQTLAHRQKQDAPVPQGFVGMNVDGPLLTDPVNLPQVLDKMVSTGVESLRVAFSWAAAQPDENGPINFAPTDKIVGLAAQRDLTVLPVVLYAPDWDASAHPPGTFPAPARDAPYAAFIKALVRRYGPRGSFWTQHRGTPKRPIRMWQIWNEPNFASLWPIRPFAPSYVRLVHAAHVAIKQVDPGAKVVLAGMPNDAWDYLKQIYAVKGARKDFDVVAAHPYTAQPQNVITFLDLVRNVMARHGDARTLLVTETGWNPSLGRASDDYCCQTTVRGQIRNVKALLPLLGANRRRLNLLGFYYYTWVTQAYTGAPSFDFAGLFDYTSNDRIVANPVFDTFRRGVLKLEDCRRKGKTATRCATPG